MAAILNLTTGIVFLQSWSGVVSGTDLTLTGVLKLADGTAAAPSLTFANATGTGLYNAGSGYIGVPDGTGGKTVAFGGSGVYLGSNRLLGWSSTTDPIGSADIILVRDAANILALKNGTNAQTLRVYGTTTGSKYLSLAHDGSNGIIGTPTSAGSLFFDTNGADRWTIGSTTGHFLAATDNTYDIGASGATRPRNLYVASSIIGGGIFTATAGFLGFVSATVMKSPADGILKISNNAETDFARLQFGGTTSAFPALKRNGTTIEVKVGDDSAYGDLNAGTIRAQNAAITSGVGTGISVASSAVLQRVVYKVTVDKTAFVANATTADVTIATLPAKTVVLGVYSDTTIAYAGLAGTITLMVGVGATPNTYIVAHDVKTAAVTKGLLDADLGTSLANATAIQGGKLESFTTTTPVLARITSGTGNVGNGSVTNMSAGSTTYYIVTERLP